MESKKKIYGVATNDVEYNVVKNLELPSVNGKRVRVRLWTCPFYSVWRDMVKRCYSLKHIQRNPTYSECKVCEEWLLFSNFKRWMESQDWEDKQLDKDLLVAGNKIYSPETCVFLDNKVNTFITEKRYSKGGYLTGAHWNKLLGKFRAKCNVNGKSIHLGLHDSELAAHKAWLVHKLKEAKIVASQQTDHRVAKALIKRYENYIIH